MIYSDGFGRDAPQNMPPHFFGAFGGGGVSLDYRSAVRADIARQNYTVCPRYWYIDVTVRCARCQETFLFSAAEQRTWYEEWGFPVDSFARHCPDCRRERRRLKALRQEYDRSVAAARSSSDPGPKTRVIEIVDQLCAAGEELPKKVHETRDQLAKQVARLRRPPG